MRIFRSVGILELIGKKSIKKDFISILIDSVSQKH